MKNLLSTLMLFMAISPAAFASTTFKDSKGLIRIQGLTPSQKIVVGTNDKPYMKRVSTSKCGVLSVPVPLTGYGNALSIAGTYFLTAPNSMPTESVPACVLNSTTGQYELATPPTNQAFRNSEGQIFVSGLPARTKFEIIYVGLLNPKTFTADQCGGIKFATQSSFFKIFDPTIQPYTAQTHTVANLPTQNPDLCLKGQRYAPSIR
jgi:hypothetical protein